MPVEAVCDGDDPLPATKPPGIDRGVGSRGWEVGVSNGCCNRAPAMLPKASPQAICPSRCPQSLLRPHKPASTSPRTIVSVLHRCASTHQGPQGTTSALHACHTLADALPNPCHATPCRRPDKALYPPQHPQGNGRCPVLLRLPIAGGRNQCLLTMPHLESSLITPPGTHLQTPRQW